MGVLGEDDAFLATEKVPFMKLEEKLNFVSSWRTQAKCFASRGTGTSRALETLTVAMPLGTKAQSCACWK